MGGGIFGCGMGRDKNKKIKEGRDKNKKVKGGRTERVGEYGFFMSPREKGGEGGGAASFELGLDWRMQLCMDGNNV